MTQFTSHQKKQLTELLSHAVNKDRVLTLTALHGFLFALAITPELILPNEWLPAVFGEEMLDVTDEKERERLLKRLFSAYDKIMVLNNEGSLALPYDIPNLKSKDFLSVREWCYGYFNALLLRPDLWILDKEFEGFRANDDVLDITTCSAIVIGVAVPDKVTDFFNRTQMKESFVEKSPTEVKVRLLALLPTAIATMQQFAHAIKNGLIMPKPRRVLQPQEPLAVSKIGRNDPCPCGSGVKFKKCCGK